MKKKPLIGIVIPVLARVFVRDILCGAITQARICGCDAIVLSPLISFDSNTALAEHNLAEQEIFRLIASPDFDAFLYIKDESVMKNGVIAEIEQKLLESQKYVMTVDDRAYPVFDNTQYDDYDDFGRVIEHLIEVHGYKRIYCLTGPENSQQAQTRLRAWKDRMTQHGLYFDASYYTFGTFWYDCVMDYAGRLISGELPLPEAIACGNDVMAVSLIKSLIGAGIRVPEDVAVTGYDGYPFTANVDVTLTTYTRNHFQLGADAVRRLYRNLTGLLCRKAERQQSGFLIGSSCGCTNIPTAQLLNASSNATPRMWEEYMFGISMAPDLAQAKTIPDLLNRALYYSQNLFQMQNVRIYLRGQEGQYSLAASCDAWGIPQMHSRSLPPHSAAAFLSESAQPEILFLSPLHLNLRQFGLISLSYGDCDRVYDQSWLHFVTELEMALDRLPDHRTNAAQSVSESARSSSRAVMHEKLVQIRSRLRESPEKPWTMEMLCDETGVPKSTLQKHYKHLFGRSVFEDLIGFRVEAAKRMLSETRLSLAEISDRCGYSSESYFMKQFKCLTGKTPTEYRRDVHAQPFR